MAKPKILVILGSIRQNRAGEKVAQWFMKAVRSSTAAAFELVDLRDYPLPMFADGELPGQRQGKHADPQVQKWLDKIAEADGYIIITPEYNHSFPSVLKNALDYPYKEWNNKPIGFVGYGGFAGGSRAVEQLRQIAAELQMYDVREQMLIPGIWHAFDESGNLANNDGQVKVANSVVDKVAELAIKLKTDAESA